VRAAILATSMGINTLNPALALNPIPRAMAVIISFSIIANTGLKLVIFSSRFRRMCGLYSTVTTHDVY